MIGRASVVSLAVLLLSACAGGTPPSQNASPPLPSPGGAAPALPAAGLTDAAALITPEGALRHLTFLSGDELMGRHTDAPGIWMAARYLAGEFRALGLEPMDEDGDFIAEYPIIIPSVDCGEVRMTAEVGGRELTFRCGVDFGMAPMVRPPRLESLVFSPLREHGWYREHPDSIPDHSLVLTPYVSLEALADQLAFASWMENVWDAGADAVGFVLPPGVPLEIFGQIAAELAEEPNLLGPAFLIFSAEAMEAVFELAGDPPPTPGDLGTTPKAAVRIAFEMPLTTRTINAPNVVARLPGTREGELKDVVLTAHFDHEPPGAPTAEGDSILNGADDNASGTVGLLEAARAFAALPTAPARSVVFAAVSAEEMGLLGSAYLAEHGPAPARNTAANLNMDMLSRNRPDSLLVFGQSYSSLGGVFQEVLGRHPELGFRVNPGLQWPEIDLIRFSDQANYLERGVPVLFFHTGFHPDLHTPDDEVELADPDKLARAARLMFYLAHAIASDPSDPEWTAEGRARVEGMQRRERR